MSDPRDDRIVTEARQYGHMELSRLYEEYDTRDTAVMLETLVATFFFNLPPSERQHYWREFKDAIEKWA
jgi:hypothetical protein